MISLSAFADLSHVTAFMFRKFYDTMPAMPREEDRIPQHLQSVHHLQTSASERKFVSCQLML